MVTYIKPDAIKDASIEGIKIKDGTISSSKIDETIATKEELTQLSLKVGELSQLQTTEKSNLVSAINEVAQGGGGEMLNFYTILNSNLIVRTLENIRYDVNGVPSTDSASNSWIVSTTDFLAGKRHDGFVCHDLLIIPFESINADNTLNGIDTQHIVNTNHEFDTVAMPHTRLLMIVPKSARKYVGNGPYNIFAYVDAMTEGEINKIADANDMMWLQYNRNPNNSLFRYVVHITNYTGIVNPICEGNLDFKLYNARNIRELKSSTGESARWGCYGCSNLKRVALYGEPTDISFLCSSCANLEVADLTLLYGHKITNTNRVLATCPKLRSLIGGAVGDNYVVLEGLKVKLYLDVIGTALDRSSLRAVINGLADLTNEEPKTLSIGAALKAKLTDEDIAVATVKNWIVA